MFTSIMVDDMLNICSKREVNAAIVVEVINILAELVEKNREILWFQCLNSEFGFFWAHVTRIKSFENTSLGPKFSALQPGKDVMSLSSLFIEILSDLYI